MQNTFIGSLSHDWVRGDIFHIPEASKLKNIPNQEVLGDIRPILWPEKFIRNGKGVVRRDLKTGRFVSLKAKCNA